MSIFNCIRTLFAAALVMSASVVADTSNASETEVLDPETIRIVETWLADSDNHQPLSSVLAKESSEVRPLYIWTIAKKALIWALRNHTDTIVKKLPAKWRGPVGNNAKKLANLIETFEDWKEGACIIGLTSMGIPPSDSQIMCQAISFLL